MGFVPDTVHKFRKQRFHLASDRQVALRVALVEGGVSPHPRAPVVKTVNKFGRSPIGHRRV
jgi:hypothetical protein